MSCPTISWAIVETLRDLSTDDFATFCHQLRDRRAAPRVRRCAVEGKSVLEIADLLVSTFTEPAALRVAEGILRQINCNEEAVALYSKTKACIDKGEPTFRMTSTGELETKPSREALNKAACQWPLGAAQHRCPPVPSEGGDPCDDRLALSRCIIQFGKYKGRTFKWLLENDVSYTAFVVAGHQKKRKHSQRPSPLMTNKAVDKKKVSKGYDIIQKPRPDKHLKMQHGFILTADVDTAKISPEKITLRYDSQDPNFYEVFIENPDRNFHLTLSHPYMNKGEPLCEPVWTCEIRKDDYQNSGHLEEKHSVDEHLSALMQKAATITTDRERLLEMLEHLKQEELKEFKWHLQNCHIRAGLPHIPGGRLEKVDMLDLVDLMLQTYEQQSVEVTKKVFRKINRNDLVQKL